MGELIFQKVVKSPGVLPTFKEQQEFTEYALNVISMWLSREYTGASNVDPEKMRKEIYQLKPLGESKVKIGVNNYKTALATFSAIVCVVSISSALDQTTISNLLDKECPHRKSVDRPNPTSEYWPISLDHPATAKWWNNRGLILESPLHFPNIKQFKSDIHPLIRL